MTNDALAELRHTHDYLGQHHDRNARRTMWVVGLTAVMMVGEIVAGVVFNSMALLADGVHMATHAGALTVAFLAYAFARKHVGNPRFTFGTGKVGDLAGFASALVLAVIAIGIAVESVQRLLNPGAVAFDQAILVAVIGLVVNILSALMLGGHHHGHTHDHHDHHNHDHRHHDHDHDHHNDHHAPGPGKDNNLRAAYVHVIADALTSVLAIAALVIGRFTGWIWLDSAMGIIGAIVIARWAWSLMRDAAAVLLDTADAGLAAEISEQVEGPGDARIVDLHVWRVGPDAHAAIISVATTVDLAALRERLRPVHELAHITIETQAA